MLYNLHVSKIFKLNPLPLSVQYIGYLLLKNKVSERTKKNKEKEQKKKVRC